MVQESYWQTKQILNSKGEFVFSRAHIQDPQQQIILAFDYYPEQHCRLSQTTIFILSEEPQTQILPISVFGKMQVDDQMVHSLEIQITSHEGEKFMRLNIPRPDLDQIIFNGKNVMFHLKNYGFMSFSLSGYKQAIREAIPMCEEYLEKDSNHEPQNQQTTIHLLQN